MPYAVGNKRNRRKARKRVNVHQNKWTKAYISTIDNSRRPTDSLSDMTNMELVQDNVVRPRPSLVEYGEQPALPVIGRSTIKQDGERYNLWVLNNGGTGQVYKQKDGGEFTLIGGNYDVDSWTMCVQSKGRAYLFNGVDNLSYVDLTNDTIQTYTELDTPTISSVVSTGMSGSAFTHYYRVSANNEVGESIASVASSVSTGKIRDAWVENTDYITLQWATVTGATSYTVYYGDSVDTTNELYTTTATEFIDYGTINLNIFKLAPEGNSTQGAVFKWMYADLKNSQLFGITNDNYLYYSAVGTGDFSPYNGGGYVPIDEDGDTELNFVSGFRDGRGNPVVTVSARGAAGKGKLFHVSFESLTDGDQVIIYPEVYEANGQSGTYAPRATIKERDSLFYPTGENFKSTGTSQNIVNILTTNNISQVIEPDIDKITVSALDGAVGMAWQDRLYFALPVGSDTNNEIWYLDLSRDNAWILRWTVSADDLWLYEDNSGETHACALVGNKILEFTRTGVEPHQDDGTPFRSRVAFESLVWDEDGITLGKIRNQYFKLLFPKGTISASAVGLSRKGVETSAGSATYTVTTSFTSVGQWDYSGNFMYGDDPGDINVFGKSVEVLTIKPKGLVNQLDWEVVGESAGTDYILSAVNTKGFALEDLVLKTQ